MFDREEPNSRENKSQGWLWMENSAAIDDIYYVNNHFVYSCIPPFGCKFRHIRNTRILVTCPL